LPTGISATDLVTGNTTINGAPAASTPAANFNSVNTFSLNHAPDVVGKIAFEPAFGDAHPLHIEAFGLWRDFYDQISVASGNALGLPVGVHTTDTSGGGFGGSVTATVWPKVLDLQASVMTGDGIGRYGSAQLADATLKPNGTVTPIPETMFLAGGTFHATPQWDFYVFGGEERENSDISKALNKASGGVLTAYGFGDLSNGNFTAAGCNTVGGSCSATVRQVDQITAGLWDKAFTGPYGQIRIGLQYSHTWLTGFAGPNGYTPTTSDDMVFTSFRYYPF
jgi:hypothetical protein